MSASSQPDGLDSLFDFAEYENVSTYQSPSLSPAASNKNPAFVRPMPQVQTPNISSTPQPLTRPSHQYELYKQQTGIVPGALASTLAINQSSQVGGYTGMNLDYMGLSPNEDLFDFNTAPSQGSLGASDMDMEFDPSTTDQLFYDTVNPNALAEQTSPSLSSTSMMTANSSVGRLWPGMHSQAALAKAQAQRQQQQQHQVQRQNPAQAKPRSKSGQPTDPIVEQKITQLLNSMRAKPSSTDSPQQQMPLLNIPKPKKDEEEMDEDERLLASEEGKKLSSKERRQLRNKVSARAFRSRRKEYISQLESEIANKVTENGDLRAQNRALMEENKRLSDLTHMLLSSPSFSDFLDQLSTNPASLPQATPQLQPQQPAQQQPQQQQQQERRQVPKDVNPYAQLQQQQRIGLTMIPEQPMDLSMLSLENDATFNFQPQVFALLETPEMPASIDTSILSGKKSNFVGEQFDSEEDKVQAPVIERPVLEKPLAPAAPETLPLDPEFESNPDFALYHSTPATETSTETETEESWRVDIFGGIEPEKVLARYELVDASEEEQNAIVAMARVQRISDMLESTWERITQLTEDF